ncbi:MAG TPA: hypothetical protein VIY86_11030, partial [Pirellulaceae bacterium]
PELLKNLGWTADDLKGFHKRWNDHRQSARDPGPPGDKARNELDELLGSLGLRPTGDRVGANARGDERIRVRDEGTRSQPPEEYREQYRAYLRSRPGND